MRFILVISTLLLVGCADESLEDIPSFKDCSECPEMVVIPAGQFMMGARDYDKQARMAVEGPARPVTIPESFALGKYEVTYAQFKACVDDGGCASLPPKQGWEADTMPIAGVSWQEAQDYVVWLSRKTGFQYSLPSEAEWEYAARGGTTTIYWWGDEIGTNNAKCTDCGGGGRFSTATRVPSVVGSYAANPFGIYDTLGNVSEYVADCFSNSLEALPPNGLPHLSDKCELRAFRGGSFGEASNRNVRASARQATPFFFHGKQMGLRVKREL